ncbi:MAG: POTRA domain-containing protein, partial [Bryobacteraceae bacterium]
MARAGRAMTVWVCLCVSTHSAARAEAADYEGRRILTIQVVPPEQPVELDEIARILPLKINRPLRLEDVQSAIDVLYATGHYTDIQVDAELRGEGVILRILTMNSWFIGGVTVTGNVKEPPNNGQLVNATRLGLGEPHSDDKIGQAILGLRQVLESNGYYNTTITPEVEYEARRNQVKIDFLVETEKRARFQKAQVTG